jgi:hypothetical protein
MISQGNSHSIAQESSEIWADQVGLQPISFKSDRLLSVGLSGVAAEMLLKRCKSVVSATPHWVNHFD